MAKAKAAKTVRIDVGVDCPRCMRPIALDRIEPAARCRSCGHGFALDWAYLAKRGVADALKGEGGRSTDFADDFLVTARIDAAEPPAGVATRPATALDRTIHARAKEILGEAPAAAEPAPREPVAFRCPRCAASLRTDGTARAVACAACKVEVDVPDALWDWLHPIRPRAHVYLRTGSKW